MQRHAEGADGPPLDVAKLLEALERHGVEYLLVGGVAARGHGASRLTKDFDCLARRELSNLDRLAAAMRELRARLRSDKLTDEEAKALPIQLDGRTLAQYQISNWRTDAGDLDVLADIPARDGRRLSFEDLEDRAALVTGEHFSVRLASLGDIIASKEWANRPKDHAALPELREIAAREERADHTDAPTIGRLVAP